MPANDKMGKINKILHTTAVITSVIGLLGLILSAFSDRVSPLFCIYFSYLGLCFPFIFILNLFILAGWVILRRWKWTLAFIMGILLCWGSISTYFPLHSKTKEIPSGSIKLLTYNVMKFEHQKSHSRKSKNKIIQYIVDSKADIVCVQEYATVTSGNLLKAQDIKQALKDYPYSQMLNLVPSNKNQILGLAIFSKFPILTFKRIPFDSEYNGSVIAELDINGKKTTIINNHLESNKLSMEERYEYYDLTKEFDSQRLDAFTMKMNRRLSQAFRIRANQAKVVVQYLEENKNPYTIVCGDFNDTPISYSRRTIKGDLEDAFVDSGSGLGISYNKYRFLFRIDYIFHSKNIKAYNCTVDRRIKNSDHYPVWTYLEFK